MNQRKPRDFFTRQYRVIRYYLIKAYCRFLKIRGEPREIALGFAMGIVIGMLPAMGFQMAIAIFIAAFFRWNKVAAAAGTWLTNPVTAPFFFGLNLYVGSTLLSINGSYKLPTEFSLEVIKEIIVKAPHILWALTLGGIIVGIPLAVIGYYLSYYAIVEYRKEIKGRLVKRKQMIICKEKEILEKLLEKKAQAKAKKEAQKKEHMKSKESFKEIP
ncbi:MAG TPA: DUF2062 domain-containing protein [Thermodesulfovibrionia bacterium]|nr:DUF2062 domain-containing protein [Thermodesulfovibrionia bacterium]